MFKLLEETAVAVLLDELPEELLQAARQLQGPGAGAGAATRGSASSSSSSSGFGYAPGSDWDDEDDSDDGGWGDSDGEDIWGVRRGGRRGGGRRGGGGRSWAEQQLLQALEGVPEALQGCTAYALPGGCTALLVQVGGGQGTGAGTVARLGQGQGRDCNTGCKR